MKDGLLSLGGNRVPLRNDSRGLGTCMTMKWFVGGWVGVGGGGGGRKREKKKKTGGRGGGGGGGGGWGQGVVWGHLDMLLAMLGRQDKELREEEEEKRIKEDRQSRRPNSLV